MTIRWRRTKKHLVLAGTFFCLRTPPSLSQSPTTTAMANIATKRRPAFSGACFDSDGFCLAHGDVRIAKRLEDGGFKTLRSKLFPESLSLVRVDLVAPILIIFFAGRSLGSVPTARSSGFLTRVKAVNMRPGTFCILPSAKWTTPFSNISPGPMPSPEPCGL